MHLLNTLPQRLDPGATPTFAGLIAPSLTSPASTPLTLGTTDSGAAITVLSASNYVGIGTVTPNKKLEVFKDLATNTLGSGEVLRILGDDGNTAGRVTELGFGVGPTGATFASALIGAVNISAAAFGTKDLYFATRSSTVDVAPTERMRIASTGTVSIASTTAGASNVGALVVAGGISAGNTGSAASYFGGTVRASSVGALGKANDVVTGGSVNDFGIGTYGTATNIIFATGTDYLERARISDTGLAVTGVLSTTGAATFAGAVTGTSTGFNSLAGELAIATTKKLYLDGGGDTYIQESGANVLDFYAGAVRSLQLTATTATFAGAVTAGGAVTMAAWPVIANDGNATYILQSAAAITAYTAGASVGTLTNAPSAGDPTKWITINDNGTLRRIPTWN